ncbi:hypothetical protein EGN72_01720 [Pseudorhodobacter sp. E13]|nr:hypothetical protein EGN72_01720 [Pseudorhodobacter sp. E13]
MASILVAAICVGAGVALGWYLRGVFVDSSLELRAQTADIDWLRAALADSEKRSAQQAEWLSAMEAELVELRPEDKRA